MGSRANSLGQSLLAAGSKSLGQCSRRLGNGAYETQPSERHECNAAAAEAPGHDRLAVWPTASGGGRRLGWASLQARQAVLMGCVDGVARLWNGSAESPPAPETPRLGSHPGWASRTCGGRRPGSDSLASLRPRLWLVVGRREAYQGVRFGSGAGDGTRTHDILLGKQTLCQLSYTRRHKAIIRTGAAVVKPQRAEGVPQGASAPAPGARRWSLPIALADSLEHVVNGVGQQPEGKGGVAPVGRLDAH